MIEISNFNKRLTESEKERASYSYLMSIVVLLVGLPLPIVNLISTFFFYIANRNNTFFVRWHCIQSLISQLSVFFVNTVGFWWTISIIFGSNEVSNLYISYVLAAIIFNIWEFVVTFYTATKVRKGIHISWWFYGDITNLIVKNNDKKTDF
ncbi:hypothetical protein [Capnocytophaga canis]|uniref:hypothetical protein n=1 Tax=Capnocytophaga canis TaxID=1848903 RepID=UPI00385EDA7F